LLMRDVLEFVHLKSFEEIFKGWEGEPVKRILSKEKFNTLCAPYALTEEQKSLLAVMLKEQSYEIL